MLGGYANNFHFVRLSMLCAFTLLYCCTIQFVPLRPCSLQCSELRVLHRSGDLAESLCLEVSHEISTRVNPRSAGRYTESLIEENYANMAALLDQLLDSKDRKMETLNRSLSRARSARYQCVLFLLKVQVLWACFLVRNTFSLQRDVAIISPQYCSFHS